MPTLFSTTFVTCYVKVYDEPPQRNFEQRIRYFLTIAQTGIPLCVYACEQSYGQIRDACISYPNVLIYPAEMNKCLIYSVFSRVTKLPPVQNKNKDTGAYMDLINGKMDFMHQAIQQNPFQTVGFAWIDFSIAHVFKDAENTCERLYQIAIAPILCSTPMSIPGCSNKVAMCEQIGDRICWRFCGGFFIGGRDSVEEFYDIYVKHLPIFLERYQTKIWEVNVWAWLEATTSWNPTWVLADHNDSIIPTLYLIDKRINKI